VLLGLRVSREFKVKQVLLVHWASRELLVLLARLEYLVSVPLDQQDPQVLQDLQDQLGLLDLLAILVRPEFRGSPERQVRLVRLVLHLPDPEE
jgi:hypothetical protein